MNCSDIKPKFLLCSLIPVFTVEVLVLIFFNFWLYVGTNITVSDFLFGGREEDRFSQLLPYCLLMTLGPNYFKLETSQGPPVGMASLPHLFVHILKYNLHYFVGQCDSTYFLSQIG